MKKVLLLAAFAGLLGTTAVANVKGDDKDKKKKSAAKKVKEKPVQARKKKVARKVKENLAARKSRSFGGSYSCRFARKKN